MTVLKLHGCCYMLLLLVASCRPAVVEKKSPEPFFSLKNYFERETARLNEKRPLIEKTVEKNGQREIKRFTDIDWQKELSLFSQSDINKESWKDKYKTRRSGDTTVYTANSDAMIIRRICLIQSAGSVNAVQIDKTTENTLYTSVERLSYYPDSLYVIEKGQKVKVLGRNEYKISGKFLP